MVWQNNVDARGFVLKDRIIAVRAVPMGDNELTTLTRFRSYTILLPILLSSSFMLYICYCT